jgi:hypothetical protein
VSLSVLCPPVEWMSGPIVVLFTVSLTLVSFSFVSLPDSQDMEIEIDRFDIIRSNTLKKYSMMAPPEGKLSDQVNVGVDSVCMLCLGMCTAVLG